MTNQTNAKFRQRMKEDEARNELLYQRINEEFGFRLDRVEEVTSYELGLVCERILKMLDAKEAKSPQPVQIIEGPDFVSVPITDCIVIKDCIIHTNPASSWDGTL